MKLKKKTFIVILIFEILTTFSSCNGQNKSEKLKTPEKAIILGKTVSGLDKRIMVVFQDKKNNFWFGGNDKGAYKYDGKSLTLGY